ncbi:MAG: nuclear transport factor 2 family protein [Nitrospira sp.]|nr:nuclear transport factor 2 family protein [Nitrospira sp.]
MGISSKVTNIKTSVTGPSGWATYEYEYKLGSGGAVLQTNQGQCTTIFRKQRDAWLIQHEHCSTASPFPFAR